MLCVVNFSHPLNPAAKAEIAERYGQMTETNVLDVPVQVDFTQPLMPQVERIYQDALRKVGEAFGSSQAGHAANVDCMILPGLNIVAVLLANKFKTTNIIVMAGEPSATPPRFMPVELIRSFQWHTP